MTDQIDEFVQSLFDASQRIIVSNPADHVRGLLKMGVSTQAILDVLVAEGKLESETSPEGWVTYQSIEES